MVEYYLVEEEEKRKGERKERGKKEKKKKKNSVWERKRKSERGKEKIFPVFRKLELDSPRTKAVSHN